jgi:hypothetical protein
MKYFLRILGAFLAAVLFGFVLSLLIGGSNTQGLFVFLFIIGVAVFSVILWRSPSGKRIFGWFSLIFGIEWLTLPISLAATASRAHTVAEALASTMILAVIIPVGVLLGIIFLILAFITLRKKP